MQTTMTRTKLSVKAQTFATLAAIAAAIALPQIFHGIGILSGTGTAVGEIFLPMHLPIILVGLLAGPYAGAAAGLLAPLLSAAMTGMPTMVMLPFMCIELCAYGLVGGMLRQTKLPRLGKVLLVQVAGRGLRALAILAAVYLLGNQQVQVSVIWHSILVGLPGLMLQWTLLPLLLYRIQGGKSEA